MESAGGRLAEYRHLERLVRAARRRELTNIAAGQAAIALSVGLAGVLLLLIAGSNLLHPAWILALFVGSVGVLVWRLRGRLPGEYRVARTLDRSLSLPDLLSSAWFFVRGSRTEDEGLVSSLAAHADRTAESVSVKEATPLRFPRAGYITAALFAATFGLFLVRYGITRSLDLRPPLAGDLWQLTRSEVDRALKLPEPVRPESRQGQEQSPTGSDQQTEEEKRAKDEAQAMEIPVEAEAYTAGEKQDGVSRGDLDQPGDPLEGAEGIEQASPGGDQQASKDPSGSNAGGKQGNDPPGGEQAKESGGNDSKDPLLQKLQEAMENLLSRLKIPNMPGSSREAEGKSAKSQSADQKQTMQKEGQQGGQSQGQGEGQNSQKAQGESGDGSEQAKKMDGGQSSDSTGDDSPGRSRTGMGSQDGKKEIREAQQLEAMGKLAEILGKRSETLTGEMTAEVASGPQRLKTPYSQQQTVHQGSGAEIHRNQVPLALQPYVQRYFEQVHKEAAATDARNRARQAAPEER